MLAGVTKTFLYTAVLLLMHVFFFNIFVSTPSLFFFVILVVVPPLSAGEVGEPRPGATEQAAAHGTQSGAEPLPVPGLVRAQLGVQRHVLHPGASGCLHQPAQRPLDPA